MHTILLQTSTSTLCNTTCHWSLLPVTSVADDSRWVIYVYTTLASWLYLSPCTTCQLVPWSAWGPGAWTGGAWPRTRPAGTWKGREGGGMWEWGRPVGAENGEYTQYTRAAWVSWCTHLRLLLLLPRLEYKKRLWRISMQKWSNWDVQTQTE